MEVTQQLMNEKNIMMRWLDRPALDLFEEAAHQMNRPERGRLSHAPEPKGSSHLDRYVYKR